MPDKEDNMPHVYTEERVEEIIKNFQDLLVEADNFPRDKDPKDFRIFWTGLRGAGSSLLGLTNHLKAIIDQKRAQPSEEDKEKKAEQDRIIDEYMKRGT